MDNRITFKQYRCVDLAIFFVITAIFEAIATFATGKWFPGQPMAISITLALILIVIHRWGAYAFTVSLAGGLAFCVSIGASAEHYLIYCGGNAFALLSLVILKIFGKEKVKNSFFKTLLYASVAYVSVAVGRFLFSLPFGAVFSDLVGFLTSDILSLLFAIIILWSFRGVDGLIEDQKAYLFRLERERKENGDTQ